MESKLFLEFARSHRVMVEQGLEALLPITDLHGTTTFNQALRAAIFPGGKRVRPLLVLLAAQLGGAEVNTAIRLACAIEFIHTSSITFDDLPGMDDARLRRSKPALHLAFGQGMAVLVAVALLNRAFSLFGECFDKESNCARFQSLIREATDCIGPRGMIAGQAAELESSGETVDGSVLLTRDLKTSGLMRLMMTAGAITAGAPAEAINALGVFGQRLGQAYQIFDDLADVSSDGDKIGKTANQDTRHSRPTALRETTESLALSEAKRLIAEGTDALEYFARKDEALILKSAADFIIQGFNPTNLETVLSA